MKRQELKDRLIGLADGINATTHGIHLITHLDDLIDLIRGEGLEGEVRESGLAASKPPKGGSGVSKPTRVPPPGGSGGSDAVDLSATIAPPWMKGGAVTGDVQITPAFPPGPRMEFPITGTDREIDIASVCVRALDGLPTESRKRVAHYIAGRFGVE